MLQGRADPEAAAKEVDCADQSPGRAGQLGSRLGPGADCRPQEVVDRYSSCVRAAGGRTLSEHVFSTSEAIPDGGPLALLFAIG